MNPYSSNDFWSQPASSSSSAAPGGYDFGQFNYSSDSAQDPNVSSSSTAGFYQPNPPVQTFTPGFDYQDPSGSMTNSGDPFADEPPLLEELGINFEHIIQKTVAVLNPLKQTDRTILQDADLAGPLVFGLAFGSFLLLTGKVHFSYIYGFGVLGCLLIYMLLTLMSPPNVHFTAMCTLSILGYCLLPMVLLSAVSIAVSLQSVLGNMVTLVVVLWCALSASKLFVTALSMSNQQALVAYPCILFYGVFALLALF